MLDLLTHVLLTATTATNRHRNKSSANAVTGTDNGATTAEEQKEVEAGANAV
jgi:hypothetical protein